MTIRNLDALFKPDAVALICGGGGGEEIIARNLMSGGFQGPIMPVDPKREALAGALTYRDIASLPLPPALAIITRPLQEAPALIRQLGERGARAALLVSEARGLPSTERAALAQAILDAAQPYLLRVLGPGSQGFNVPRSRLNVCLNHQPLLPGEIAFITESGTIGQTALDLGNHHGFGFSHLIHLGDSLDVDLADVLDYLAGDFHTRAILLYLEHIGDARKFMSAARRAARTKPVVVLKPRRYPEEPDDAVYAAAFRRAGLLRVDDSDELLQMIEVLRAAKRVNSDRLAIVSNSSSMSLLATDTLYQFGGRLAQFSETAQQGLEPLITSSALPNPVDLGDQADADAYGRALDLVLADPGVDGVLVIKTPSALSETTAVADAVIQRLAKSRQSIIASFPGPQTGATARQRLLAKQVPTYETASAAVRAFMRIVQYKRNQALLMETPPSLPEAFTPDMASARAIISRALSDGRADLNEYEAIQLLAAYGIPVAETRLARSPDEAAALAAQLHPDLTYGLPPLNLHLAREMMAQTRIYQRLRYSLLRRANLNAVALTLVKVSQMVVDLTELVELDINPLWVNAQGVVALDARVRLTPTASIPVPRLAIRPYPTDLEETITLPNERELLLRPVLPEDEPPLQALVSRASPEDLRRRFFQPIRELSHEVAATLTQIDYHREMALVAVGPGVPGKAEVYGIVNLSADPDNERAEYSILVDRALMGQGLGNRLMRCIIHYARTRGIQEIYGEVLTENKPMLQMNRALGFAVRSDPDDPGLKHVVLPLHQIGLSIG
ncbi:MAG: GCN5-related N-acetyltransferase [Proteobacteria bacterium]|nr:GCN5-related N-acetyltransferase [Pseudomonadota bacterium]